MSKLSPADYDPLFLHARRELGIVVITWLAFGVWVIAYSGLRGYVPAETQTPVETVAGVPRWVFWGIAVPWVAANIFTFWFAFRCMADDPLTAVAGEGIDESNGIKSEDTEVGHD